MTDKPLDLSATEARTYLRLNLSTILAPADGHVKKSIVAVLDALDARDTLAVAGDGEKFTMAQAGEYAETLMAIARRDTPALHCSVAATRHATDAARFILYLAAMLDAANVKLADAKALGDTILERHNAYVRDNPAAIRLSSGQVVRFVSPVTPNEVQILSEEPFACAQQAVAAELSDIEISGQAKANLPPADMIPTVESSTIETIADELEREADFVEAFNSSSSAQLIRAAAEHIRTLEDQVAAAKAPTA